MIRKDTNAQIHVLEAIIVAGMIFAALYFIQGLTAPVLPESHQKRLLHSRAETALATLDSKPDETYHSLLTKYMIRNSSQDNTELDNYLWQFVFPCYGFEVYYYNLSAYYKNTSISGNELSENYIKTGIITNYNPPAVGKKTQVSRFFVYQGFLYEAVIETWYV